jgi:serine/threonine-protein kinase HipA
MGMPRTLEVVTPEGHAGSLVKESRHVFNYRSTDPRTEVGLALPIRAESYASFPLHPLFAMNLPEGFLLEQLRRRLAKFGRVDDFLLLERTGRRQIGRLQFLKQAEGWSPPPASVDLGRLLAEGAGKGLFEHLLDAHLESGIAGVQPKVLVPDAGCLPVEAERATLFEPDLIVKAAGEGYPALAANEFACMSAARRAGLAVPDFWLSDDAQLFVMRRFDLDPGRRGFEDIAALTGLDRDPGGHYKYRGSYEAVATVVAAYAGAARPRALSAFFDGLVLSVLVRNGHAHLKNFGLTYSTPGAGDVELAPLFDVVTTVVYPQSDPRGGMAFFDRSMALRLFRRDRHRRYPGRPALLEFGRKVCGLARPELAIERIAEAVSDTLGEDLARVPEPLRSAMAEAWRDGIDTTRG